MPKAITINPAIQKRLLKIWSLAPSDVLDAGMRWYQDASKQARQLAKRYRVTYAQAVGVIAAISPGCEWSRNMQYAEQLLAAHAAGKQLPTVGTYGRANIRKAERILAGEEPLDVLGGRKVRAFYATILTPKTSLAVTVDRHAIGAARGIRGDKAAIATDWMLRYVEAQYLALAKTLRVQPHQAQAVIWEAWRKGIE